ncbi:MAG: hypothetical protein MJY56_03105 [Bacteroidales bacterium]|nr:hypothetical protein [Bacteroidales bacterium]
MKSMKRILRCIAAMVAVGMVVIGIFGCGKPSGGETAEKNLGVEEVYRLEFPSPEGYELVIGYVSEDNHIMEVSVWESGKKACWSRFTVLNGIERGLYSVDWREEYAVVTLWGSEMEEKIYLTISYSCPSEIVSSPVEPAAEPSAVDLGLSVLWASMNVGGEAEYKHGYHYLWSPSLSSRIEAVLGPGWRLPRAEELQELVDECNWKVLKSADVDGCQINGRKPGYYNAELFLPFSGTEVDGEIRELRISGGYWSSTAVPEPGSDKECPMYLFIKGERDSYGMMTATNIEVRVMSSPTAGLSVRAVRDKEI